jgi:hypothetical protein
MKARALSFFSLFTSAGTLVCCALPALFVALGMGATFAGLVGAVPQLIWLSEHKTGVFLAAAAMLIVAGVSQWRARNLPCPLDADQARACAAARKWANRAYFLSVFVYLVGAAFAFLPALLGD